MYTAKYVYPAVFEQEENGVYSVSFPDIQCCYSQGVILAEAAYMAADALQLMLYTMEQANMEIPVASDLDSIKRKAGDNIVMLISCDTACMPKK